MFISYSVSSLPLSTSCVTAQLYFNVYSGGGLPSNFPNHLITIQSIPLIPTFMQWSAYATYSWTVQGTVTGQFTSQSGGWFSIPINSTFMQTNNGGTLSMRFTSISNDGSTYLNMIWYSYQSSTNKPYLSYSYQTCSQYATCSTTGCVCNNGYSGNGATCIREWLFFFSSSFLLLLSFLSFLFFLFSFFFSLFFSFSFSFSFSSFLFLFFLFSSSFSFPSLF